MIGMISALLYYRTTNYHTCILTLCVVLYNDINYGKNMKTIVLTHDLNLPTFYNPRDFFLAVINSYLLDEKGTEELLAELTDNITDDHILLKGIGTEGNVDCYLHPRQLHKALSDPTTKW